MKFYRNSQNNLNNKNFSVTGLMISKKIHTSELLMIIKPVNFQTRAGWINDDYHELYGKSGEIASPPAGGSQNPFTYFALMICTKKRDL
jgi:hypothetical protein